MHRVFFSVTLMLTPSLAMADPIVANTPEAYQAEVIEASRSARVVVMFDAGWCGPCRMIKPPLIEVADEQGVRIVIVDIDANPTVPVELGIQSIPMLILYRDGIAGARLLGAHNRDKIADFIGGG